MLATNYRERLQKSALNLNDLCEITPFGGRRKRVNLNRNKIDIVPELYPADSNTPTVFLPLFKTPHFHYQLQLEKFGSEAQEDCFVLKTIIGEPYQINGQLSRESFVEKDDVVYIGQNRLIFKNKNYEQDFEMMSEHPCLENPSIIDSPLHVYLEGETGTGKTHLAKKIHECSRRPGKFVHINLAAFSPQLIESELFGHTKGSFTGAIQEKEGAFLEAHLGTLFIDEIDSVPAEIQTKLLLFLDHLKIRPVGGREDIEVKTKLIISSGRPLVPLVEKGDMRRDFYYRITSGIQIKLEPVRSSQKMLKRYLMRFCLDNKVSITERLEDFYATLPWPGNYRQLKGHLNLKMEMSRSKKLDMDENDERLMLVSTNLQDLDKEKSWTPLDEYKKDYVYKVLSFNHGQIHKTARILQISPNTLKRMISEKEDKQF